MGNWGSSTIVSTVPVTAIPTFSPTEAATAIATSTGSEGHHHLHPTLAPTDVTEALSMAENDHSMGSLFMLLVVAGVFYFIYQHIQKKKGESKAAPMAISFELPGLRMGSKLGYEPIADDVQADQV